MARFILNRNQQSNGDHEVHNKTTGCAYMPFQENQVDLGEHFSCRGAVKVATDNYQNRKINGCFWCCRECHTT